MTIALKLLTIRYNILRILSNYNKASETLRNKIREQKPLGQDWKPTRYLDRLVDPNEATVEELLSKQLQLSKKGVGLHSEIIPEIDRSMLAGVRLPLRTQPRFNSEDMKNLFESLGAKTPDIERALTDFAEQQNVPIYRWPPLMAREQAIKGLSGDPFRGKWGWKPGTREYKTSSQLPEIFGIKDLP